MLEIRILLLYVPLVDLSRGSPGGGVSALLVGPFFGSFIVLLHVLHHSKGQHHHSGLYTFFCPFLWALAETILPLIIDSLDVGIERTCCFLLLKLTWAIVARLRG